MLIFKFLLLVLWVFKSDYIIKAELSPQPDNFFDVHARLDPLHPVLNDAMKIRVGFWKKIYSEVLSNEGFLHDKNDLSVIYERIKVSGKSRRSRSRNIKRHKRRIRSILNSVISKNAIDLTEDELNYYELAGRPSIQVLKKMKNRIRFQRGMKDRFYQGLVRSQNYIDQIRNILRNYNIPSELAFMPHIESSFNLEAYSKVGAAGIWQFMRSTARLFMKLNYIVDQRRDPIISSHGAAKLLNSNYKKLKAWPLAITAYNHGSRSLERASRRLKTKDISKIIKNYDGPRFRFASKNFYTCFLAAYDIASHASAYFPDIVETRPFKYSTIELPYRFTIADLTKITGLGRKTLRLYNPSLRPIIFRRRIYLPYHFNLHVPQVPLEVLRDYRKKLLSFKSKFEDLRTKGDHIIQPGESLYSISKLYGVGLNDLIVMNNIDRPSRVRAGIKINIPAKGQKIQKPKTNFKKALSQKKSSGSKVIGSPKVPLLIAATTNLSYNTDIGMSKSEQENQVRDILMHIDVYKQVCTYESTTPDELLDIFNEEDKNFSEELEEDSFEDFEQIERQLVARKVVKVVSEEIVDFSTVRKGRNLNIRRLRKGVYRIRVESDETIGHFADWIGVRASQIRRLNRFSFRRAIRLCQTIKLPISSNKVEEFVKNRLEYHLAIEEDFYGNFRVTDTTIYRVRRGDSMVSIMEKFGLPIWLLRKYQGDPDQMRLVVGEKMIIPVVISLQ